MSTTITSAAVAAYVAALDLGAYDDAVAAYVAASSGDKARMRVAHQAAVTRAMATVETPDDIAAVKALMAVSTTQSEAVGTKAPVAVDPRVDTALAVAALITVAVDTFEALDDDAAEFVAELVAMGTGADVAALLDQVVDGPGITGDVRAFASRVKVPASRRNAAPGRDIAAHVFQVLSEAPDGAALTVAQIRAASSDEYPDGAVSDGAISARLFPRDGGDCTIAGVVPVMVNGVKGARLA